jgi:nicotinamidase-related amidase
MAKTGLLVIDMQVGLFEGKVPRHDADGVVERINTLACAVRAKGGSVVFVQHEDDEAYSHGSREWQLLPTLDRRPGDVYVRKTACDSFYRSDLDKVLRERGIGRLLATGCATEFCVDTTIRSAASKDYEVIVVADGHTTKDRPHIAAEAVIAHHNWVWSNLILPGRVIRVMPTAELLAHL